MFAQASTVRVRSRVRQSAAGTLSGLLVNVSANNLADDATVRTRKNAVNGGQIVTITASTTGQFTDSSGSDAIVDGDTLNYQVFVPADDPFITIDISTISTTFAATTDTVIRYAATATTSGDLSDGQTYFSGLSGGITQHTTEAWQRFDTNASAVYKNLFVYVVTNLATSATPIYLRKNGANTTVTTSCTALTTGVFEDRFSITGNSDTSAANDDMNYYIESQNLSSFNLSIISIEATSTDKTFHALNAPEPSIGALAPALTTYVALGGGSYRSSPETIYKNKMAMKATTSNFTIYVSTDTIT